MFRADYSLSRTWRRNDAPRNPPFTFRSFLRSWQNGSPAPCPSGPEPRDAASGATPRSPRLADAPGVPTSVEGPGSANTSGVSHARQPNVAPSTAARDRAAAPHVGTARSTTSPRETATAMDRVATTTSIPTRMATAGSRCSVVHTTRRSPRPRRRPARRPDGSPRWRVKLRSSRGVS